MKVLIWRFPEPVALVKVIFVEDAVVKMPVVTLRFVPVAFVKVRPWRAVVPVALMLFAKRSPVELILNLVVELVWKWRKSPAKLAGLIPM